jgi:hypothetical protein
MTFGAGLAYFFESMGKSESFGLENDSFPDTWGYQGRTTEIMGNSKNR